MSDLAEFLSYCVARSKTEDAWFDMTQVKRLLKLAGKFDQVLANGGDERVSSVQLTNAMIQPLVDQARKRLGDPTPSFEQNMVTLRNLSEKFYWMCFHANVGSFAHPFLEFNGLMSVYVDVLAKSGVDPQQANVHGGVPLPVEDHQIEYLAEKLECIFAPIIAANPNARGILERALLK
jgi:hypothetical protein